MIEHTIHTVWRLSPSRFLHKYIEAKKLYYADLYSRSLISEKEHLSRMDGLTRLYPNVHTKKLKITPGSCRYSEVYEWSCRAGACGMPMSGSGGSGGEYRNHTQYILYDGAVADYFIHLVVRHGFSLDSFTTRDLTRAQIRECLDSWLRASKR